MDAAAESVEGEVVEREVTDVTTLMQLNKSEYDMQIATAKRYPRSVKQFISDATGLATLSEEVASECMYALKRRGADGVKTIEGPSARFAEIVLSCWGNARAAARVIDEDDRFVTSQGIFLDLQKNIAISIEVPRRITTRDGDKYSDDMVGVTANAACSIALRNAVLKGIPKAFWKAIYDAARQTAIGNADTLVDRRIKMMGYFQKMGVTDSQIYALLEVKGIEDITLDHMALLKGLATAIKDGDTTIDQAFQVEKTGKKVGESSLNEQVGTQPAKSKTEAAPAGPVLPSQQAEPAQQPTAGRSAHYLQALNLIGLAQNSRDVGYVEAYYLGPGATVQLKGEEAEDLKKALRTAREKFEAAQKPLAGGQRTLV